MKVIEFFVMRQWSFSTNHLLELYNSKSLTDGDRKIFNFDVRQINWDDYLKNYVIGVRRYIFKEKMPMNNDELVPVKPAEVGLKPWYFTLFYLVVSLLIFGLYFLVRFALRCF